MRSGAAALLVLLLALSQLAEARTRPVRSTGNRSTQRHHLINKWRRTQPPRRLPRPTSGLGIQININIDGAELERAIREGRQPRFTITPGPVDYQAPYQQVRPAHQPISNPDAGGQTRRRTSPDRSYQREVDRSRARQRASGRGSSTAQVERAVAPAPLLRDAGLSVQDSYRQLARGWRLMHQSDSSLARRNLLVPDGGLCASTCATDGLLAAYNHLGRLSGLRDSTDTVLHKIVYDVQQRAGKDARLGLDFGNAARSINRVAATLVDNVGVNAERVHSWVRSGGLDYRALRGDRHKLAVWAVDTGTKPSGERTSHAIVVLGMDSARQIVEYSDPNHPNNIRTSRYRVGHDNKIYVDHFNGPKGGTGELIDLMHLGAQRFDPRYERCFARFAGKRVWLTDTSGNRRLSSVAEVCGPSAEYPCGRLSSYSYQFGSGGGGACSLDSVACIETATAKPASRFNRYVNKDVRVTFADSAWKRAYGSTRFRVKGISTVKDEQHPFGGLKVSFDGTYSQREGVIPFEAIECVRPLAGSNP